jgi:hypothetical protein
MNPRNSTLNPFLRWTLLIVGCLAVVLAIVGMFLPILPTIPFLLLAVACFARSSTRFYSWLLDHGYLGPLIRPYLEGGGIPRSARIKAIVLLWTSIGASVFFFIETPAIRGMLLVIAAGVTLYLLRLPTAETDNRDNHG